MDSNMVEDEPMTTIEGGLMITTEDAATTITTTHQDRKIALLAGWWLRRWHLWHYHGSR